MSTVTAVILCLLAAIAVIAAVYMSANQIRAHRLPDYMLVPNLNYDGEQYVTRTPAGPAVVTKVLDERGYAFEIETSFGRTPHLTYVAPSTVAAKRRLRELAEEHLATREGRR